MKSEVGTVKVKNTVPDNSFWVQLRSIQYLFRW